MLLLLAIGVEKQKKMVELGGALGEISNLIAISRPVTRSFRSQC